MSSYGSYDMHLSLSVRQRIDQLCLQFEDGWLDGQQPRIEAFLCRVPEADQRPLLHELLGIELEYRRRLGQVPDQASYLERFLEFAEVIQDAFAQCASRPTPLGSGKLVDRYRIERPLGSGAFGNVYLALDLELQRQVAIKVPRYRRVATRQHYDRLLAEARNIARLKHPGIVPVYDVGQLEDGRVYLVMPFVDGTTLAELTKAGPVSWQRAAEIIHRVATAIQHAHSRQLIHRDLKPANILIDRHGQPFVTDFGLAMSSAPDGHRDAPPAGTLPYMAPEQLAEQPLLDARCDVWALGVLLYQLLTGRLPFSGSQASATVRAIREQAPPPLRDYQPAIPRRLERLCLRCLEKDPHQRFADAGVLAGQLQQVSERPLRGVLQRMAVLIICVGLVGGTWWGRLPERHLAEGAPPTTLTARLEVLVYGAEPHRRGLRLDDRDALPIRRGDHIRVEAALNRPAYVYLLWINARGEVAPLYPWPAGHWTGRGDQLRDWVGLPEVVDQAWPMEEQIPDGLETVLLLARRDPLPSEVNLRELLSGLRRQPFPHERSFFWYDLSSGRLTPPRRDRGPVVARPTSLPDAWLWNQRQIGRRLSPHFELLRTLSFAWKPQYEEQSR